MLNETDLAEYYEWLGRKSIQQQTQKGATTEETSLFDQQLHHIRELIRIQQKLMGIRS